MRIGNRRQYRVAYANGWHCGHWHYDVEGATDCINGKKKSRKSKPTPV
jgi:hypothetical protein